MPNTEGYIEEGKKVAKKQRDMKLHSLWGESVASPLKVEVKALNWHLVGLCGEMKCYDASLQANPHYATCMGYHVYLPSFAMESDQWH